MSTEFHQPANHDIDHEEPLYTDQEWQELLEADERLDAVIHAADKATAAKADTDAPEQDLIRVYLNSIGKIALLNAEAEVGLSKRIEAGMYAERLLEASRRNDLVETVIPAELTDEDIQDMEIVVAQGKRAKEHLLDANQRLVVSLANRYTGRGLDLLDLIQEGNLGLIRAVEKFDYTKGFKFSTYATWWIRQSITRGIADQGRTIRLPVHMVETINKIGRVQREMIQNLGHMPSSAELADEIGKPVEKIHEIQEFAKEPVSLDMPIGDGEEASLGDLIRDADSVTTAEAYEHEDLNNRLVTLIESNLDPRAAHIVKLRFGLIDGNPLTLDQIGAIIGLTRERIRQIENQAMTKLRNPDNIDALRDYID